MLHSSLTTMGVVLLGTSVLAQSDLRSRLRPITAPVKNAGILHLATGAWTRPEANSQIALGTPEVIVYANTCGAGYYFGMDPAGGEVVTDEGALPRTDESTWGNLSDPCKNDTAAGCADSYNITGFQIGYCTNSTSYTATISFMSAYETDYQTPCNPAYTADASFTLACLPASTSGTQACWSVGIDVTGLSFTLAGHGPAPNDVRFGWTYSNGPSDIPTRPDGPIFAGDFANCSGTDGTRWDRPAASCGTSTPYFPANYAPDAQRSSTTPGSACPPFATNLPRSNEQGTGMLTFDAFRIHGSTTPPVTAPGCYFFEITPYAIASFHLELYSDVNPCPDPLIGTPFCFGTVASCPCALSPQNPGSGCGNESGTGGAKLTITGSASISADLAAPTVFLNLTNATAFKTTVFIQGTTTIAAVPFGDGLRCVAGAVVRLNAQNPPPPPGDATDANGNVSYPNANHTASINQRLNPPFQPAPIQAGEMRHYFAQYRDSNPNSCQVSLGGAVNTTNAVSLTWGP